MAGPFITNALNFPNNPTKASPTGSDAILLSDAADSNKLKKALLNTLPFAPLAGGSIVNVTTSTQQLAKDTVYFVNYTGGVCVLTLPTAVNSAQGDWILVIGGESASNPFQLQANALQSFRCLDQLGTAAGTLTATTNFDWCMLRCDALTGGLTWATSTNNSFTAS